MDTTSGKFDRTSTSNLLRWFGKSSDRSGRFSQVGRDLGLDPEAKLREWRDALPAAQAANAVQTALLPGWNVLCYESPVALAATLAAFADSVRGTGAGARRHAPLRAAAVAQRRLARGGAHGGGSARHERGARHGPVRHL